MTPGVACAAPGPMAGVGALASRPRRLLRARLPRLAGPRGGRVRVCPEPRRCQRSDAPLRLPHAPPQCLRVPAGPAVPVVPAFGWRERPGGAAGLARGAVSTRWTPRRAQGAALLRDGRDRRLRRRSRVPVLSLAHHALVYDPGGLCPGSPQATEPLRRSSARSLSAVPPPTAPVSGGGYPVRDHDVHTTFAARYSPC